jgi:hypothetical protein
MRILTTKSKQSAMTSTSSPGGSCRGLFPCLVVAAAPLSRKLWEFTATTVMIGGIMMVLLQQYQVIREYDYHLQSRFSRFQEHEDYNVEEREEKDLATATVVIRDSLRDSLLHNITNTNMTNAVVSQNSTNNKNNEKGTTQRLTFTWPNISENDIADLTRSWWKKKYQEQPQHPSDRHDGGDGDRDWWCTPTYDANNATSAIPSGLLYVKVPKAASSTMAGITLRIAHRHGRHRTITKFTNVTNTTGATTTSTIVPCQAQLSHGDPILYKRRKKDTSFLFATIRDPAQRALSDVFYRRSNQLKSPYEEDEILKTLQEGDFLESSRLKKKFSVMSHNNEEKEKIDNDKFEINQNNVINNKASTIWSQPPQGYQLSYMAMTMKNRHNSSSSVTKQQVATIMQQYDFILLVERMGESLVVLQFLLNLTVDDVLHLNSKAAGDFSLLVGKKTCRKLHPPVITSTMATYLSSSKWHQKHYGDYLLHAAVHASLDRTIQDIGSLRFDTALQIFRQRMALAQEKCSNQAMFPCSSTGKLQLGKSTSNCYEFDWGCGYPCLDALQR